MDVNVLLSSVTSPAANRLQEYRDQCFEIVYDILYDIGYDII